MEIVRKTDIKHTNPSKRPLVDYPYALSSTVFNTEQLFYSSELVRPGTRSSAPHYHRIKDEIIFVTTGELHAFEGDIATVLKSGDSICFRANSFKKHFLENRSKVDATFLLFRHSGATTDDVVF